MGAVIGRTTSFQGLENHASLKLRRSRKGGARSLSAFKLCAPRSFRKNHFKNSSGETPACFKIARNVPSGISPG